MSQGGSQGIGQLDTLMETLAKRERRRLLYYLREHDTATQQELVDVLTGWAATDRDRGTVTKDDWVRMQTALHHVHLPRLEHANLVEYDPSIDVVRLLDLPPWVERCLDAAFEGDQNLAADRRQPTEFLSEKSD
ncbi:DUF7344 domain-containing protein [Halorientalis salina]|uniref:DUF7344 domain-containing protein n=1 Tax=Halorientalis salina TaxID=2932266 RepID=UPI0010AD3BA8|nr:ArsR family transcriptional regulator [Halorientalis salina]